jgi:hypothetical protein
LENVPPLVSELKVTVPLGVVCPLAAVSLTVALHVVGCPMATVTGAQDTAVEVVRFVTVTVVEPLLVGRWSYLSRTITSTTSCVFRKSIGLTRELDLQAPQPGHLRSNARTKRTGRNRQASGLGPHCRPGEDRHANTDHQRAARYDGSRPPAWMAGRR